MKLTARFFSLKTGTSSRVGIILLLAAACWMPDLVAQESLPPPGWVAERLADDRHRQDALLTIAVLARFQQERPAADSTSLADRLRQDRDWLLRLISRYGAARPHGPALDPSAWLVHLELEQHQLQPNYLVSPTGPGLEIYLEQVFNRANGRLAAVMLPELLWLVEPVAGDIWAGLLQLSAEDEVLRLALAEVMDEWLPDSGSSGESEDPPAAELVMEAALQSLDTLAASAINHGPPDRKRLGKVRYDLLLAMPSLGEDPRADATAGLRLAGLIDGLYERRYFAFAEGLVSVVSGLLARSEQSPDQVSPVAQWLVAGLPGISANYAKAFAVVDPSLNSALAAAYDVVQNISRTTGSRLDSETLRRELADAVAQLALMIPDLDFYFELPVRDPIAGGVDACAGMMAQRNPDGSSAMTRELFDDCQETLVNLADVEARAETLSGDFDGPFGPVHLKRELSLTPGQRINYGIGYLHERYSTGCGAPARPLPNPLEWSALATLLAWFAEQSPVYFQTPENEQRLQRMRVIGNELMDTVAEQVDCFAGSGASLNDPVSRSLADYREALVTVSEGINDAITGLRDQLLAPGADIALELDALQPTAYRPEDLVIGPCDTDRICEMADGLNSTRALVGLFSDTYLIADQSGYGKVDICYENMEWVRRRSAQVRADDTNVANYFGYLAFDLKGRFIVGDERLDVFGFRFTSPDEQHYLFAAANEDVLNDSCPMEWVGSRIVTPLKGERLRIVPDRLTYLAAPRMLPSRLLSLNWDRGAEWRDWFITGIGIEPLDLDSPADIRGDVTQHLQSLYRRQQIGVYNSMQLPDSGNAPNGIESSFEEVTQLTTIKKLIRMQMMLFYPRLLAESDAMRSAVAGQGGLLDRGMLARFREDNVPVSAIRNMAFERLERFHSVWRNQAEAVLRTGTVSSSLGHAMMRLNALYWDYFAAPSPPPADNLPDPMAAIDDGRSVPR
jgi:hypothetical protein